MQTRLAIALAAAAPLLWAPVRSHAQDFWSRDFIAPGTETWTFDVGGIVNRFDSTLRLDPMLVPWDENQATWMARTGGASWSAPGSGRFSFI